MAPSVGDKELSQVPAEPGTRNIKGHQEWWLFDAFFPAFADFVAGFDVFVLVFDVKMFGISHLSRQSQNDFVPPLMKR